MLIFMTQRGVFRALTRTPSTWHYAKDVQGSRPQPCWEAAVAAPKLRERVRRPAAGNSANERRERPGVTMTSDNLHKRPVDTTG